MLISSTIIMNRKIGAVFLFDWIQFFYYLTDSIFLCTHIHTSIHTYIIFFFSIVTFLLQFLIWSHTLCCWKHFVSNALSQVSVFILMRFFQFIDINTIIHAHTISHSFYCRHYFTVFVLWVIIHIVLFIYSTISVNRNVSSVIWFDWIQFSYYLTGSIFSIHSHSYFKICLYYFIIILFLIVLQIKPISSYSSVVSKVCLIWLNQYNLFHIFIFYLIYYNSNSWLFVHIFYSCWFFLFYSSSCFKHSQWQNSESKYDDLTDTTFVVVVYLYLTSYYTIILHCFILGVFISDFNYGTVIATFKQRWETGNKNLSLHLFCEALWSRSCSLVIRWFHLVFRFWTAVTNRRHLFAKSLSEGVDYA